MTTPKFENLEFADYIVTTECVVTKKSNGKVVGGKKNVSLYHPDVQIKSKQKCIGRHILMGYTFFKDYSSKEHKFIFLDGNENNLSVDNMKMVEKNYKPGKKDDEIHPRYKDIVFTDYTITEEGVIMKISGKKPFENQRRVSLEYKKKRPTILKYKLMGFTFFKDYIENDTHFEFLDGDDMNFSN